MNFLSRKTLSTTFSSLYRIQLYSFVRNTRPRAPKFADNTQSESSTSKWTKTSSVPDKKVVEDFLKNQNGVEENDQEVRIPQEEVFDHTKFLQAEIRRQLSLQALFDYYNLKKSEMDLINYCTCLNQAVNLYRDANNRKNESELIKKPEIVEILNHLKSHANEMDNFTVSNFLSNIAKMNVLDRKTVDILVNKTLHNNIQLNEKPLTYITWTLGKMKINNPDFLNMVVKRITQSVTPWKAKSVTNVFWAMSELDYKNKAMFELMQTFIIEKRHQFDPYDLNLIFNAYNNYRMANYDILDAVSHSIIRNIQKVSFRSLANIANYCANLNYVNNMLMDQIEREIVKRLKKSPQFQNLLRKDGSSGLGVLNTPEENVAAAKVQQEQDIEEETDPKTPEEKVKITGLDEKINLMDITQILVSFCKLKVIKSELFEILELYFIQNLDKASGASIVSYAFAHSALCNEMLQKYQANKKTFLKRSLKNLKKYNHTFYEVLIPFLDLKLPEFTPEEIFSLLVSASRPPVTKRVIRRGILEFAIAGIPKIGELRKTLTTIEFEKFIYKYNLMLQKYIDKNIYVPIIVEAFKSIDVNILLIDKAYSQILSGEDRPRRQLEDEKFFEEEEEEDDDSASDSDNEEVAQTKTEEAKKKRRRRGPKVIDLTEDVNVEESAESVQKETKN